MRKGEAGRSVGVSCRDFVPPEKACPVVQAFSLSVGRCPTPCQGAFLKKRPLEPPKTFLGHKGKAGRSVSVSCRDFVPPEKAWPFQVVQVGGIAEKPRAFGRMPPTMHESTKHQQRGRRPVSIDRFPKNNGSGVPGSLPFHEKYVAHPQKSFRIDPFFKRGRRVQGGSPAKIVRKGAMPAPIDRRP